MAARGIVWEGPSPVDGAPLVAIATDGTRNTKTGDMVQVWILRADMNPAEAVQTGQDVSICGHCPERGRVEVGRNVERGCYVRVTDAPLSVWRAYKRGAYGPLSLDAFEGRLVRWGAYGDPAMLPESIVRAVNARAAGWTGYTHQWKHTFAQWARGVIMASVETVAGEALARARGWGTFRAAARDGSDAGKAELCLSEREGFSCAECLRCDGGQRAIYIPSHGSGAKCVPAERLLRKSLAA